MLTLPLVDFHFVLISLFHCDEKLLGPLHLETVISFVLKYVLCWFFSLLLPFSFFMVRHQPFIVLTSCISSLIFMLFSAIFHLCLYLERKFNFYLQAPLSCFCLFVCLFLLSYLSFKNSFLCFEFLWWHFLLVSRMQCLFLTLRTFEFFFSLSSDCFLQVVSVVGLAILCRVVFWSLAPQCAGWG